MASSSISQKPPAHLTNGQEYLGVFSSRIKKLPILPDVLFDSILHFLEPLELALVERVCRNWKRFIDSTQQWRKQCQIQLGLPNDQDPTRYLPPSDSYKKSFQLMSPRILGKRIYEFYLGKIGPVPSIPKEISLKKWNDPDPCDPKKPIGDQYVWMYCPSHIEIDSPHFSLDGPDRLEEAVAPCLVSKPRGSIKRFFREHFLKKVPLKVPVTFYNLGVLFQLVKKGFPSFYKEVLNEIMQQHGNKRISAGWICMRKELIGQNRSFPDQQNLAERREVAISEFLPRVLFNLIQHTRSNIYPDSRDDMGSMRIARTSTLTVKNGQEEPTVCTSSDALGLGFRTLQPTFFSGLIGVPIILKNESSPL